MAEDVASLFRVKPGKKIRLRDHDTAWTGKHETKEEAEALLARNLTLLTSEQEVLWATQKNAVLVVLQAMDTAGKDGLIKHVMSGVNPQGCQVFAFKQPTDEELKHTFLWRASQKLPERGYLGIFNRSYYEDVLVVRVHPDWLEKQNLDVPKKLGHLWDQRYQDINNFEKHLVRNGTVILKFFLHISKEEQAKRLLARIDTPDKLWKFSAADLAERGFWPEYMKAYQDALGATSTEHAPWYIIPSDHKWVSRWLVSEILATTIKDLNLKIPPPSKEMVEAARKAKKLLEKS